MSNASNFNAASKLAAGLCLAVSAIHWMDQGGLKLKDPTYMGVAYFALELASLAAALMLLTRTTRRGWLLALGVAAGPLLGFVVTRTTGLPGAMDDIGNWAETLGWMSLVVESALLAVSAWALVAMARPHPQLASVRSASRRG
ncbi:MAG: hypothetical protein JO054_14375 [Actinobacteria bacterium]|nr:hypothetical protein [Actinomycetota bacterium]